ncbi:DUF4241 domain-containing protein [Frigoriflavimonas asaccharolytica]|uniref:DUF4241 domain-containing protein n=1 Tax=Frigoriflavimonas asaccharolytica TaxID=2735899 RepID=A0A8J8G9F6_9FLAO|nr:DUF4241 domain-containing protein [Frigoriflavimonas asaccharolytica]NRS93336.1 hypothetical protein [Frigoriflavimonas asaccharolytica]
MQHLKNIEKLFSKNFIESPLVDTFDAGKINITSGSLVASDPLTTSEMQAFDTKFPLGEFPVLIHKEIESNCIAYVEIIFKNEKPAKWKMATTKDQNLEDLDGEEIFGYPSESGMGCLMDWEAQKSLQNLEQKIYQEKGEQFCGIYEEFFRPAFFNKDEAAADQFAILQPNLEDKSTILAFETGYGDGFYASYIAFDKDENPLKIITEFIEIDA